MSMDRATEMRLRTVKLTQPAKGDVDMLNPLVRLGLILRELAMTDAPVAVTNLVYQKVVAANAHAQALLDALEDEAIMLTPEECSMLRLAIAKTKVEG